MNKTTDMGKESKLRFNGTWRSYQKRILDDLNQHLNDSKLHVVAAPGAGKTTLGIEVIARINRPALILCPTNTIKSQWRERICSSFLEKQDYGLVSTDIREPSLITVITYQALLAAFCGNNDNDNENGNENGNGNDNDNENDNDNADTITASSRFRKEKADEVIARLRQAGVSLLCFDEAHHLRNEWWKALTYLNEHLKPEQSIALTATPPYDVEQGEWKRYNDLCGDIDEVISIPELVKNGDLCPHQDFVYFSFLKQNEWELIKKHKENVKTLIEIVRNDKELLDLLSAMRFLKAEDADLETILDQPGYYVAIASLLSSRRYRIPDGFLRLFDSKQKDLPPFNTQRAADFLNGFLHPQNEYTEALEAKRTYYLNLAKRLGLVANNKIVLDDTARIRKQIAGSLGKLDSIIEIAKLESQQLRDSLRMVILADFIRLDDITCSQLGVMPIWRKLEEALRGSLPMGVLCGSIMLLPKTRTAKLHTLMVQRGMSADAVAVSPFKENEHYITVTPKESARNLIVAVITDMFNEGDINVLIGTQALLGEGWDAPSINSLILSSTVSSYMLSNQMRGRAIRIDKNNPAKVSNIWHLATIGTPSNPSLLETLTDSYFADNRIYTHDLTQLETRFRGYEAPSYRGQHEIISGIERVIDLSMIASSHGLITLEQMATRNQKTTLVIAADRELTRQWWKDGLFLGYGEKSQLSTGVQESPQTVKSLLYTGYKALAG